MRILLDTNIIIPLEDSSKTLGESFAELVRLSNENNHFLLVHPSSKNDIERDSNEERKKISLSRLSKYSFLETPPIPTRKDLDELSLKEADDNDRVDNFILYAIYRDAANILVTEDRELHRKAKLINVSDRIHYLQQAVEFLKRLHARELVSLPNIVELPLYQINIGDSFFDSLREDYKHFNEWYQKASQAGRKAWVYKEKSENPSAICIYKEEDTPIVTDDNRALPTNALKLCTFKVGEDVRGRKIGELFLKAAFRYAFDNRIEKIYVHMRSGKQDFLKDLCLDFGFEYFGEYKLDEVYVKDHPLKPPSVKIPPLDYNKKFYPHFLSEETVGKFIVPIIPTYHRILFPDNQDQLDLFQNFAMADPSKHIAGNAIKQAYLCHAPIGSILPGDILLFYRSHDKKAITSLGIVEFSDSFQNINTIIQLVSKRTVYSYEDIKNMAEKKQK
jgi:predicted nucleic acid-binding protein